MIFSTHKKEVDKLNLKKIATDFVLNVPKCKKNAVPEWNRLWLTRNQALWAWIWEFEMSVH